ncbi:MAG: hypothetical protein WA879_16515 [Candidatus Acidiferrales bacterium]
MDFSNENVSESSQEEIYRVEVSGWDATEAFFVEKAALTWGREHSREVALRCTLRVGAIVFVRLIRPIATTVSYPVPYRAVEIASKDPDGQARIKLEQLHPLANRSEVRQIAEAGVRVA